MRRNTLELVKYNAACRAIAEARAVDEVKDIRDRAIAMAYYKKQAENKELVLDAQEIRARAERRIGLMIKEQKETVGLSVGGRPSEKTGGKNPPVSDVPTLAQAGIDKDLAKVCRKYAKLDDNEFEEKIQDWRESELSSGKSVSPDVLNVKKVRGTQGTGDNEWYTPREWLIRARDVLGEIDIDPASNPKANEEVRAKAYFTAEQDGLKQDWIGKIWCNPPYSQPAIGYFAEKMVSEVLKGNTTEAIMLTHNYTDTKWFQHLMSAANAVCFTAGRVKFYDGSGEVAAPTQGQAFTYFGPNIQKFWDIFADYGTVLEIVHGR